MGHLSARGRLLTLGVVSLVVVATTLVLWGEFRSSDELSPPSSSVEDGDSRDAVINVVTSIEAGSPIGFAPEVYEALEDPQQVLPSGATVVPVEESLVINGDRAMMDAVVKAPGVADVTYWLFLERRDGVWVVTGTIGLSE